MLPRKGYNLKQVSIDTGIDYSFLVQLIERKWISPTMKVIEPENCELDEEDIARSRLILELKDDFGVNDEGIPIILHLLDELYATMSYLQRMDSPKRRATA